MTLTLYILVAILVAIAFMLGRLTTIVKWLKPSAETSAAWQRRGNGE